MFVVWRGWGWLTLLFLMFAILWGLQIFPPIWQAFSGYDSTFAGELGVGWGIGWILSGVLLFLFAQFLLVKLERIPWSGDEVQRRAEAQREGRRLASERGERYVPPSPPTSPISTFFWIPLRWLALAFVALGIVVLVINIPIAIENLAQHADFEAFTG